MIFFCLKNFTLNANAQFIKTPQIDNIYTIKTKEFLKWYKTNFEKINKIQLINFDLNDTTSFYTLNNNIAAQYITYIKNSNLFSNEYIENLNKYLLEKGAYLNKIKQKDGPPIGFDFDLILFTHEQNYYLDNINELQYTTQQYPSFTIIKIDNDLNIKIDKSLKIVEIYR